MIFFETLHSNILTLIAEIQDFTAVKVKSLRIPKYSLGLDLVK